METAIAWGGNTIGKWLRFLGRVWFYVWVDFPVDIGKMNNGRPDVPKTITEMNEHIQVLPKEPAFS